MEDVAGSGIRIALGIDRHLFAFAGRHAELTWVDLVRDHPDRWKSVFLSHMSAPAVFVVFNLDGVNVWGGVARAASGGKNVSMTDWELLQVRQNPRWWARIEWWRADRIVANPFQ